MTKLNDSLPQPAPGIKAGLRLIVVGQIKSMVALFQNGPQFRIQKFSPVFDRLGILFFLPVSASAIGFQQSQFGQFRQGIMRPVGIFQKAFLAIRPPGDFTFADKFTRKIVDILHHTICFHPNICWIWLRLP